MIMKMHKKRASECDSENEYERERIREQERVRVRTQEETINSKINKLLAHGLTAKNPKSLKRLKITRVD